MEITPGIHPLAVGTDPFMGFLVVGEEGARIDEEAVGSRPDYIKGLVGLRLTPSRIAASRKQPRDRSSPM